MRSLQIRKGIKEAGRGLLEAARLLKAHPLATLVLGMALAVLPALLSFVLLREPFAPLFAAWEGWIDAVAAGITPTNSLSALYAATMDSSLLLSFSSTLLNLLTSLVLSPVLLSALALLYNSLVDFKGISAAIDAAQRTFRNARSIVLVALICMAAEWLVQMMPSVVSGLLTAVAGLLSFIPIIGPIATVLAAILSVLVTALTSFAVMVIFCYVWISASVEGVSGIGALVRSWQLTRNQLRETITALLGLVLLRFAVLILLGILWVFVGRPLGVPLSTLVASGLVVGGLFTVLLGAESSALYQRRPAYIGSRPGDVLRDISDLDNLKRANIDGDK